MRPLRPLFRRSASKDELERQAERLRNRDWVEVLRVIHPAQALLAEQQYLLSRFRADWPELVSRLLAQHSQPAEIKGNTLVVFCDHNTFANELTMVRSVVEKTIMQKYGYALQIKARATQRLEWPRDTAPGAVKEPRPEPDEVKKPSLDQLIAEIEKFSAR